MSRLETCGVESACKHITLVVDGNVEVMAVSVDHLAEAKIVGSICAVHCERRPHFVDEDDHVVRNGSVLCLDAGRHYEHHRGPKQHRDESH